MEVQWCKVRGSLGVSNLDTPTVLLYETHTILALAFHGVKGVQSHSMKDGWHVLAQALAILPKPDKVKTLTVDLESVVNAVMDSSVYATITQDQARPNIGYGRWHNDLSVLFCLLIR